MLAVLYRKRHFKNKLKPWQEAPDFAGKFWWTRGLKTKLTKCISAEHTLIFARGNYQIGRFLCNPSLLFFCMGKDLEIFFHHPSWLRLGVQSANGGIGKRRIKLLRFRPSAPFPKLCLECFLYAALSRFKMDFREKLSLQQVALFSSYICVILTPLFIRSCPWL